MSVMRRLEFTEPLPWTKDPVYRWLTKSVHGVRFRADAVTSSCCGPDGIINVRAVVETTPDGRQSGFALGITHGAAIDTDFRLLATFLQLLVHEARHNNGKPHTCGTKDQTTRWALGDRLTRSNAGSPTRLCPVWSLNPCERACCAQPIRFADFKSALRPAAPNEDLSLRPDGERRRPRSRAQPTGPLCAAIGEPDTRFQKPAHST